MRELWEKIIPALEERVRCALANAAGCHDYDHTLRVRRNAARLAAALPGADPRIVAAAALLHDIARPEELAGKGAIDHAARGSVVAHALLIELGATPETAQRVANCVRRHRFRSAEAPETLEEKIIYDADKLDSLGATGIGRAFLFAGREGARLHNRADEALAGAAYGREDTAYREYLVKLVRLPERMLTAPGQKRARELAAVMTAFFTELNREVFD